MIFSTRSTYGLRAMINLAKENKAGSVSLAKVAKEENISLKYLERLFSNLKKAGLVKATKGAAGGYVLAKKAGEVKIYDIIRALEGNITPFHCTVSDKKVYCSNKCDCEVNYVLAKVEGAIDKTLKEIRLGDLLTDKI